MTKVLITGATGKKSQKTPKKEIDLALKLKNEYFNLKNKNEWTKKT